MPGGGGGGTAAFPLRRGEHRQPPADRCSSSGCHDNVKNCHRSRPQCICNSRHSPADVRSSNTQSHTHARPFNGPFSRTTRVSLYQKGKPNLDFTEARDSEWQWHQLGHMQVCTSLQTDKHAGTPPLSFLQTGCPSCRPTNSVKALTAGY